MRLYCSNGRCVKLMVSNSSSENALSATIVVTFDAIVVLESTSQIPSLGFKYKYYDIFRHQPFRAYLKD